MACLCGFQSYSYQPTGEEILVGGSAPSSCSCIVGTGGAVASGSATYSTNALYDGYSGVFHLGDFGPTYINSTGLSSAVAYPSPHNPRQSISTIYNLCQWFQPGSAIATLVDTYAGGSWSVSFWFNPLGSYETRTMFSRGTATSWDAQNGYGQSIVVSYTIANLLEVKIQTIGLSGWEENILTGVTILQQNCYYHVAVVFESGVSVSVYLDGVLETSDVLTETQLVPSVTYIQFGTDNLSFSNPYSGTLQEVRYINTALSPEWINTEFLNVCDPFYTVS